MYGKIQRQRDNFIYAALNAEDPKMKKLWLYRAEQMEKLLKRYSNYPLSEVRK